MSSSVDFATHLKQSAALRRVAKSDPDAFEAYRRMMRSINRYSSTLDRISRRDIIHGSLQEEVDAMRGAARDALLVEDEVTS